MIDLRIDAAAFRRSLERAGREFEREAAAGLKAGVSAAYRSAKTTAKFKDRTGELRRSIVKGQFSSWRAFVKAGAKHALFVEEDTRAHAIVARRAKALRFVQAGAVRFAHSVWHPGTTGKHFMQTAADEGESALERAMRKAARAFR